MKKHTYFVFIALLVLGCDFSGDTSPGDDSNPPKIYMQTPSPDAQDCSVKPAVKIWFDQDMESSSINSHSITFQDSNSHNVPGTWKYTGFNKSAEFTFDYNLDYNTSYTVIVGTDIINIDGVKLETPFSMSFTTKKRYWTIMAYIDADADPDEITDPDKLIETVLLESISMMASGFQDDQGLDLVVLLDRKNSVTDSFDLNENFTDTRMYRLTHNTFQRIGGGSAFPEITAASTYEANMGDANTLKKFIESVKEQYPAEKYALFFLSHGQGGAHGVCRDVTSGNDWLYTAELTDVLDRDHSVDLVFFHACRMGSVEMAYQLRSDNNDFHADIMVASPAPITRIDYTSIFSRLTATEGNNGEDDTTMGEKELYHNPAHLTAKEFGALLIEEIRDYYEINSSSFTDFAVGCYDLSKVSSVKNDTDALAKSIWDNYHSAVTDGDSSNDADQDKYRYMSSIMPGSPIHYFDEFSFDDCKDFPYYDIRSLASEIACNTNMSAETRLEAEDLIAAVNEMVLYSYATSDIIGFTEGENGISLFASSYYTTDMTAYGGYGETPYIAFHWWYNPQKLTSSPCPVFPSLYGTEGYGNLSWCRNGATAGNGMVENWFEFIDDVCDQGYAPVSLEGWNGYLP